MEGFVALAGDSGHFAGNKTAAERLRMIAKSLPLVDAVAELLDARLPQSSRNPEFNRMTGRKPRLVILNKADMADPDITGRWMQY